MLELTPEIGVPGPVTLVDLGLVAPTVPDDTLVLDDPYLPVTLLPGSEELYAFSVLAGTRVLLG